MEMVNKDNQLQNSLKTKLVEKIEYKRLRIYYIFIFHFIIITYLNLNLFFNLNLDFI